jgi:hypothetical protein
MDTAPTTEEEDKPKPRRQRMVTVYNASKYGKNIHLGGGRKIPPGASGKMPLGVYEKIEHLTWVKKADRGDV